MKKKITKKRIKAKQKRRSKADKKADGRYTAKKTSSTKNQKRARAWMKNPKHSDLWGIDTKKRKKSKTKK